MNTNSGKYYMYRHIRLDTNQPFYIGIGTKKEQHVTNLSVYDRAFSKKGRNKFWNNIKSKTDYKVEILLESDDQSFIFEKEKEFIKLYGRRNDGTGILSNCTSGGEGNSGVVFSPERKKLLAAHLIKYARYERTDENKRKISLANIGAKNGMYGKTGKEHKGSKPILQYTLDNIFIAEFESLRDAGNKLKIVPDIISFCCKGKKKSYKGFIWKFKKKEE